ncbi:MAG: GNAT family N-acetyltransferase [Pseudomonadales bacterium]
MPSEYEVYVGSEFMDVASIHAYLTTAYWSEGIPIEVVTKAVRNSVCCGAFFSGQQIGFARAVTDAATFAYIADVYVLEAHRGNGLAKKLIASLVSQKELQGLRRMMLATRDAHSLYERYGFKSLANPDLMMENWNPKVYSDT